MTNEKEDKRPTGATSDQIIQWRGFSKGTCQGLLVCVALLALLILIVYVFEAPPVTNKAILADVVLGLLFAVAVIWVVGGTIEFKTSLYNISIKATGGVAILLTIAFHFSPFYNASGHVEYDEYIDVGPWDTVGIILEHYEGQQLQQADNAIFLDIPPGIRDQVLKFRAVEPGEKAAYKANWWIGVKRKNPKLRILDQIEEQQDCLSFVERNDKIAVKLNTDNLEKRTNPEGEDIFVCKQ